MNDDDNKMMLKQILPLVRLEKIVWNNSNECYAYIDGEEVPIHFETPEGQVIIDPKYTPKVDKATEFLKYGVDKLDDTEN